MNGETTAPAPSKRCTKCGDTKPLDDFHRAKKYRDGRASACKACKAAYYAANSEGIINRVTAYYAANREEVKRKAREHRAANRQEINRKVRERRAANREEINRKVKERRAANREEINRKKRVNYSIHREKVLQQQARYREANREEIRQRQAKEGARNRARTDEELAADRARLRPDGLKRCRKCRHHLEFVEFSAARSNADGLNTTCRSCDNRGLRDIAEPYWHATGIDPDICGWCGAPSAHVDHIHPLALGGTDTPENLLPACQPCNNRKHARPPHVWITEHVPTDNVDAWLIDPRALDGATVLDPAPSIHIIGPAVAYEAV